MRTILKYRSWSLLLSLLLVISCSREELSTLPVSVNEPFTIQKAKNWTETFVQADSNRNQLYSGRKLTWKQAIVKHTPQGIAYVQVPMEEEPNSKRVIYDPTTKDYVLAPKLQLLIYNYPNTKIESVVMELVPTGEYAGSRQGFTADQDFSGLQILRNWKGQFIKGNKFDTGRIINKLSLVNSSNSKARLLSCTRYVHEYIFISCTSSDGTPTAVGTTVDYPLGTFAPYPPTPDDASPLSYISCYGNWQSNGTDEYELCSADPTTYDPYNPASPINPSDPFNPLTGSGSTPLLELFNNKKALFGPCPGLTDAWRYQIDFKASSAIKDRLNRLASNPSFPKDNFSYTRNDWYVQSISGAIGSAINLDNFSVYMDNLPIVDGHQMTIDEFANYIRLNINQFVDGVEGSFYPHPGTGENEAAIWQSYDATGAIISITIYGDPGSVIVSKHDHGTESSGWTFSTIHDPLNGDHPVSGTRVFTLYQADGGYIFSTQGADRLTNYLGTLADVAGQGLPFKSADALWQSMQTKLAEFINQHQAHAEIRDPVTNRPVWSEVKRALDENRSLSTLPCN